MKLGMALKLWRAANDMSQQTAAEYADISLSAYRRFEAGKGIDHSDFLKLLTWLVKP